MTQCVSPHPRSATEPRADRLLNVHEAAALLGVKPGTLYGWKSAGRIRAVKLTGKNGPLRFRLSTLLQLIAEGEQAGAPTFAGERSAT